MFSNFKIPGPRVGMLGGGQMPGQVYGGSVDDAVGPAQTEQSSDLYTRMRGTNAPGAAGGGLPGMARAAVGASSPGAAPDYTSFMKAAIQQRRASRPGAAPMQYGTETSIPDKKTGY